MVVAIAGHEALPRLQRSEGQVLVEFKRRAKATVLSDLYQRGCGKVRFPIQQSQKPFEAVLINTAGGLTDGDVFTAEFNWLPGSSAIATTQAAERIYRARSGCAKVNTRLSVGDDARAAWLPQETILFDAGRCERMSVVDLTSNSHFLAMDALVLGRTAMQEIVKNGRWLDRWRVHVDEELVFADGFCLDDAFHGDIQALLHRRAVAGAARTIATGLLVSTHAAQYRDAIQKALLAADDIDGGVTRVGNVLFWRLVTNNAAAMRAMTHVLLAVISDEKITRNPFGGFSLPRVFHC